MTATAATTLPDWHVAVDGCTNFRDAGGWPIGPWARMRTGALYRSDDPVRLTAAGRTAVDAIGLAAAVDLRQHSQFVRGPGFLPAERTVHVPLVDRVIDPDAPPRLVEPTDMADLYVGMLDRSREPLGLALDAVAANLAHGPVLVHCAYGKDRAGLVTALVQAAIGVPADAIAADYGRSHEPSRRRRVWMLAEPLADDPPTSHVPPFLFSAPVETMDVLLARMIREHGSLAAWAASFPCSPHTIEALRHELTER